MNPLRKITKLIKNSSSVEKFRARHGLGFKLARKVKQPFKIGMAITAYERPEYLETCLDSLFKTNLHDYDITFLLQDDGSKDPRVAEIINKVRDSKYKIERYFTTKQPGQPNNAAHAINKAVKKLLEMDDFDIIGWGDADALFHPEWLDQTMKVCLWAKANHRDHVLGPFTSFNSSDFVYHQILGTYKSPYGNYVVKRQAGMLNYFYFKEDFLKLGYFEENPDDETLMTQKFENLKVRNFSTETSWVEHLGQTSLLRTAINTVHAIKPAPGKWGDYDLKDFRTEPVSFYADIERKYVINAFNVNSNANIGILGQFSKIIQKRLEEIYLSWQAMRQYNKLIQWWRNNFKNLANEFDVDVYFGLRNVVPSNLALDIVIPVIERDLDVLYRVVNSVRDHIKHPLKAIYIVSPKSEKIEEFCKSNNCININEDVVLPITIKDVDYMVNGKDRSGWLFQQLIKLGIGEFIKSENYLVLDGDTVFIRDQVFEENGKIIFDLAEESHSPYFSTYSKLLGEAAISPFSFVAHHMLINSNCLNELKAAIQKETGMIWYEAIIKLIDREDPASSGFSEYETYGNFMFYNHMNQIKLEYCYNISEKRQRLIYIEKLIKKYKNKYKTLSFQYYK